MTWECTWVKTHTLPLTKWLQHTQLLDIWLEKLKASDKVFMDNFFTSPRLFDNLDRHNINLCRTVWPNRKNMPCDFGTKQMKLKRGDIRVRTRGGLTALVWKDRREVYMLTWTHHQHKEIFLTATTPWNLTSWNSTTSTWVTSTILIVWLTAIQWDDVLSSWLRNCFSTFWI